MGFLSLLNHQCRNIFSWQPVCVSCLINVYLKGIYQVIKEHINSDDQWDEYSTYSNLFLHDYRVPSQINPFKGENSVEPIPRGVIEHHDLDIIPPTIVRKEKAYSQAARCKETPSSIIAQEQLLQKLQGKEGN